MTRISVICGTGMSSLSEHIANFRGNTSVDLRLSSKWGEVPANLVKTEYGDLLFIDRHHSQNNQRVAPHKIEHRANVHAAASMAPDLIISINSVGSMHPDFPPGSIGVALNILDLATKPWSFHDDDTHMDRTTPFDRKGSEIVAKAIIEYQNPCITDLIVAQCVGPQFETVVEINALEKLGATVVGMTLGPEQRLISETKIPHVALCCSSNWAAGRQPGDANAKIDHHSVDTMAGSLMKNIFECLSVLLKEY